MEASEDGKKKVLVVAARTAATPGLIEAVRERAKQDPCEFTLLVPKIVHGLHYVVDPQDQDTSDTEAMIELALPLLESAAGGAIQTMIGDYEPLAAIEDAVNMHDFDEIILSTLPTSVSRWLHLDLPHKVAGLGLPVTTVTAPSRQGTSPSPIS